MCIAFSVPTILGVASVLEFLVGLIPCLSACLSFHLECHPTPDILRFGGFCMFQNDFVLPILRCQLSQIHMATLEVVLPNFQNILLF